MERQPIALAKPTLGEPEIEAARRVILSGWLTQGPEVAAFEGEFATAVSAPLAVAVSNCTTALHLALLGVGVGPGDEVITVSHSFIATTNAIRYCGALPVFADVDLDGFNMLPAAVEAAVTPRTRAILCVHQMGMPCDLPSITAIARHHGLAVVEDAACAIGSEILVDGRWRRIGQPFGDAVCFSFHPRKILTTGDGGMITFASPDLDRRFRLWRQHGMSVSDVQRHGASAVVFEEYACLGYNYRMTDLQAAVGRAQLRRLDEIVAERRRLAATYGQLLGDIPGLGLPRDKPWTRTNWQSYCVLLPEGSDQRAVMQRMLDEGIATRRGIMCAHREPACADIPPRSALPNSEAAQDRGLILPLFPGMLAGQQERVAEVLGEACR